MDIPLESLLKEYSRVYDKHAKNAEMNDEEKHRFATMIIWKDYVARPPATMMQIVMAGIGGDRLTSSNKLQGEAMVLVKNYEGKYKLRRLVMQESAISARSQLVPYAGYKVKLGEFAAGGDLVADDRADFSNPVSTGLTFEKLMEIVKAVRVPTLAEAVKYASKENSAGYSDSTDWKIVRGVIASKPYVGLRKDKKTRFGVINLIDTSLGNQEPELTDDGQIVRPGFTAWIAPELAKYAQDSLIELAGPISIAKPKADEDTGKNASVKTKKASMNAYAIKLIAGEILEDEKDEQ